MLESLFSKVTRNFCFSKLCRELSPVDCYFPKRAFLYISKNSHLNRIVGLQSTSCSATEIEFLNKFFKSVLEIWKISMKDSVVEFFYGKLQAFKLQRPVLHI